MDELHFAAAAVLLATVAAGLARVLGRGTRADAMLAVQLFGTSGVATLILLAGAMQQPSLLDVALTFALLAAVTTVAFVRRAWSSEAERAG